MIRYSLVCEAGHAFESWFPSGAAYDEQRARGLVSCPVCGDAGISKAIMAPSLGQKGNARPPDAATPPAAPKAEETRPVAILSEKEQAFRAMLRAVREHVTQNSDYVGRGFVDEARKMHYGEIEHRSIYGEAAADEAKALVEEGITVHALPVLPDDRN